MRLMDGEWQAMTMGQNHMGPIGKVLRTPVVQADALFLEEGSDLLAVV